MGFSYAVNSGHVWSIYEITNLGGVQYYNSDKSLHFNF